MTSPSKLALLAVLLGLFGLPLIGCGSSDVGTPSTEKVDVAAAAQKQGGAGGIKAAHGGGIDEGIVPAKPGEATGPLQGGKK